MNNPYTAQEPVQIAGPAWGAGITGTITQVDGDYCGVKSDAGGYLGKYHHRYLKPIKTYKVPCRNFEGYTIARIVRETTDRHGQKVVEVEALKGNPWSEYSHGGWCQTNKRRFYPEALKRIEE